LPVGSALIGLLMLVGGSVGRVVALGATVAVGAGVALGEGEGLALALGEGLALGLGDALGDALGLGEGLAGAALLETFAVQVRSAPPPLAEPLHWLILRAGAEATVPAAVQFMPTRVPPLAEPLHCVIVAPVVVAGNGLQPVVMPPPEPTHWFTVTAVEPALAPS
jgi:hypothetical protein